MVAGRSYVQQTAAQTVRRGTASLFLALATALSTAAQTDPAANSRGSIESALRARDFDQALQLAQTQLKQSPKDARLWTLEGIALTGLGDDQKALVAYDKALQLSPNFLAALEGAAELEYKAGRMGRSRS